MELMEILKSAVEKKASDIFIISGLAVTYKENGIITKQNDNMILPAEAERLIKEIYRLAGRDISRYEETGDDDFSVSVKGLSRFRISAYKQRGSMAAVIRVVEFDIPDYKELNIPQEVITDTVARTKGLVLVTYSRPAVSVNDGSAAFERLQGYHTPLPSFGSFDMVLPSGT